jgi:D-glycero-D-manno-heptose 1,7-bisphosphate phosphatase
LSKSAVFLDRDDTLIRDRVYLSDPEGIELLPGAPEAIRLLNEEGIPAILVTNQSGIARGIFDEERLGVIHGELKRLLADRGARLDAVYYCPHHPEGKVPEFSLTCTCRKPGPGMLMQAARDFGLDLRSCFMIGDKAEDVLTIHGVGGKSILVDAGKPLSGGIKPDFMAQNLIQAVQWILSTMKK